jgi:hypothetical protein
MEPHRKPQRQGCPVVWTLTLREAHWECRLVEMTPDTWLAEAYRDGCLATWYRAPTQALAIEWAEAMLDALNNEH